jgi:opacity protein-like surface antigen
MRASSKHLSLLASLLLLLVTPSRPVHAQSIRFVGVDGMMQTVKAQGQSGVSGLALRTRLESDDLPLGVSLMPSIEYWRNADRLQDFGVRSSQSDLTMGLDGRYDFGGGTIAPYVGGGLGLHFINQQIRAPTLGMDQKADHTRLGPDLFLGAQLAPVGAIQSFVEAKFAFVSDYRQFKLNWGLGVDF